MTLDSTIEASNRRVLAINLTAVYRPRVTTRWLLVVVCTQAAGMAWFLPWPFCKIALQPPPPR